MSGLDLYAPARHRRKTLKTCPDCGALIAAMRKRCIPCADVALEQTRQVSNAKRRARRKAKTS